MLIKNFSELALSFEREILLKTLNFGLESLNLDVEIENLKIKEGLISIGEKKFELKKFSKIILIGFGKGSLYICLNIYKILKKEKNFKGCFVIDFKYEDLKIESEDNFYFFEGDHPLVSRRNVVYTKKIIKFLKELKLQENDLVLTVICGGGSSMFEIPAISLSREKEINKKLLACGANISEINTVRKHISLVKGGSFLKFVYPAKLISLIVCDIPTDDYSIVASGPTFFDRTTKEDAIEILKKYNIEFEDKEILETLKDEKYFKNVFNFVIFDNLKVLKKMEEFAKGFKIETKIISSRVNESTENFAKKSIKDVLSFKKGIYLFGGETTVCIKKKGKGGRNQDLALRVLKIFKDENIKNIVFLAFNSDGWDNSEFGGAISDKISLEKIKKLNLDIDYYLNENLSFYFFKKTKDYIFTGRLPINVSDFILIFKTD